MNDLGSELPEPDKKEKSARPFAEAEPSKAAAIREGSDINSGVSAESSNNNSIAAPSSIQDYPDKNPKTAQRNDAREPGDSFKEDFYTELPDLPRGLTITLILLALLSILADAVLQQGAPKVLNLLTLTDMDLRVYPAQLIPYLPLHAYWTICILKIAANISKLAKQNRRTLLAIANGLSLLTVATLPQILRFILFQLSPSGYGFESSWWNTPAELLKDSIWYALQCGWPILFFHHLRNYETPPKQGFFIFLACTANFLLLPHLSSTPFSLYLSWTVAQFACIWLLCKKLSAISIAEESQANSSAGGRLKPQATLLGLSAGQDIVLNYHPFAAITRWRKQQEGALSKDLKVIISIALPVLFCCYMLGLNYISAYETEIQRKKYIAEQMEFYRNEYVEKLEQYRVQLNKHLEPVKNVFGTGASSKYANFELGSNGKIASEVMVFNYKDDSHAYEPLLEQKLLALEPYPTPPTSPLNPSISLPVRLLWDPGDPARNFELSFAKGPGNNTIQNQLATHRPANPVATTSFQDIEASKGFLSYLCAGTLGFAWIAILFISSKPTHIGLSRNGWRFLWRRRTNKRNGEYIRWTNLARIFVESKKGSTSPLDQHLCFEQHNGSIYEINMGSLESIEDREALLKSIEKWGRNIQRAPEVQQALQAPADHSYTELWLQALSAPPQRERLKPLLPGTLMKNGHYKVIDAIGTGGQGQAYLAYDQEQNTVVLKECILPVFVDVNVRRKALEQFENEARLLRQLDHPQIVKLLDFFVEDHRTYLVLEHINGQSLRQLVKSGSALPEKRVRELAKQMCVILAYLHGLKPPVVHRDFTPDNLILRQDGTLKLIDFNVAKQVVESTTSGTVVGKHAYLPPEQFRGMPECASDIYAFGATLHFLLCGKDPEPISTSHPKRVSPELSDSIDALVSRATALDLQKRYKSVEDIVLDLEK